MDVGVQGTKRNIPQWAGYDIVFKILNTTPHHVKTVKKNSHRPSLEINKFEVSRFSYSSRRLN